jgi:hypothetical protein
MKSTTAVTLKTEKDGKYHCQRSDKNGEPCGHAWLPRKKNGVPVRCPKCFSPHWFLPDKPKQKYKCPNPKCRHQWASVISDRPPLWCPKCHTPLRKPELKSIKPTNV